MVTVRQRACSECLLASLSHSIERQLIALVGDQEGTANSSFKVRYFPL